MIARTLLLFTLMAFPLLLTDGCSLQNHDGPDVTCADLQCGRINACRDGIIAQCVDGKTVKYNVCTANADDICEKDWQVRDQYKCLEFETECEGCRPERVEGCAFFEGTGGQSPMASSSTAGVGGSGGAGGN